ncbi:hypothetical protein [Streptomyces acidicola]|uniref:hypothetical protein n=1 Tax=Streptomyces acidicola TaxID=2596892 RepID=UPI00381E4D26
MRLRLLSEEELDGDPAHCVELELPPQRTEGGVLLRTPGPIRITPTDVVRLGIEVEQALVAIHVEATRADRAWREALGSWHGEGRAAIEASSPDVSLLVRVLEALRRDAFAPT